jgi:adenylate cyclase
MTSGEDPPSSVVASGRVRKLTAILSADVEGYSRLMGEDDTATVQTLTLYRAAIQTLVREHRGRVVDSTGDNVLAEFASVVDAVQCAVAIQRDLATRNISLPLARQMKFRVGVNLGDIIVDGERIYGDGVNIAARLQSLAAGGGICIAESVHEQVKGKLALRYEDMGLQSVKNIAQRVRVHRVRDEPAAVPPVRVHVPRGVTAWGKAALAVVALLAVIGAGASVWRLVGHMSPPPTKPSIAVLPFINISGEADQEYFSDGMTEDLITELARLDGLLIIARNSAFTYKGKTVRPEQVSRELGVRYTLEGSVRRANNRIRISAQLVDGTTGFHVWAQSYDRDLDDIFAVQGEIARMITRSLAVRLTAAEERHMANPPKQNQDAWKNYQEGLKIYRGFTAKDNAEARAFFEKAIRLDPKFSKAYALLAATHRQDWILGWTRKYWESEHLAYENAEKAVELARQEPAPKPSLSQALQQLGYVYLYKARLGEADDVANEAVDHSPSSAEGWALGAHVLNYRGKPKAALAKADKAISLDPNYPFFYDYHRGHAYYVWGFQTPKNEPQRKEHFKEAERQLRKALERSPNFRPARSYLVATLSELGRQDEAVAEMVKVRSTGGRPAYLRDPKELEKFIKRILPYEDDKIRDRLVALWQAAEKAAAQKQPRRRKRPQRKGKRR